jgi:hypothetical protein
MQPGRRSGKFLNSGLCRPLSRRTVEDSQNLLSACPERSEGVAGWRHRVLDPIRFSHEPVPAEIPSDVWQQALAICAR